MPITIQPYEEKHESAVDDFNRRLETGGADPDLVFFRWAKPRFLPRSESSDIYNEYFIALDGNIVRGGYALKHQRFSFPDGSVRSIGYYHHPLSEGIVDKSHAIVGSLLLRDAMQRSPLLYCLGMGGYDRPLPKMLIGLGWKHFLVPFYFRIVHPSRFLRQAQALRTSTLRKLAMDLAALSGLGWLANTAHRTACRLKGPQPQQFQSSDIDDISQTAAKLWQAAKQDYTFTAVRDSAALGVLYKPGDQRLAKLLVGKQGTQVGWSVVGARRQDPKFGEMRVGSIVDCWASAGDSGAVIAASVQALESQGMDLIVSNQSHHAWCRALETCGFLKGPSNFIFAASKKLSPLLEPFDEMKTRFHLTRADGDGLPNNF